MSKNIYNYRRIIFFAYCIVFGVFCATSAFSFGKIEESQISIPTNAEFLSPANADGVNDSITISLSDTLDVPNNRKIVTMNFQLFDSQGSVVRNILEEYTQEQRPSTIVFDGNDDAGVALSDGIYVYVIRVTNDKGNESTSDPVTVIIDNEIPNISSLSIHSGNVIVAGEEIVLNIRGSAEVYWATDFIDSTSQEVVRTIVQETGVPTLPAERWTWNGLSDNGQPIADGFYQVRVRAQDQAGNKAEFVSPADIVVSSVGNFTLKPVVGGNASFSPNSDDVKDVLSLQLTAATELFDGITLDQVEYLVRKMAKQSESSVADEDSESARGLFTDYISMDPLRVDNIRDQRSDEISTSYEFDFTGLTQDLIFLEDGLYEVALRLRNDTNNIFQSNPLRVMVDTEFPAILVQYKTYPDASESESFVFGGVSKRDVRGTVTIYEDIDWQMQVLYNNTPVYNGPIPVEIAPRRPLAFTINDRFTYRGKALEDGLYSVRFSGEDAAGNIREAGPYKLILDTEQKYADINLSRAIVSGRGDPLVVDFDFSEKYVDEFYFTVTNADGGVVKSESLPYAIDSFSWDARDNNDEFVPNGEYELSVEILYKNGSTVQSMTMVGVDSIPPQLERFELVNGIVNIANPEERVTILQASTDTDVIWNAEVRNIFDTVVHSVDETPALVDYVWDGMQIDGSVAPDGDYFYSLRGTDNAGNITILNKSFIVDTGGYDEGIALRPESEFPKIYFPGYSDDIFSLESDDLLYENLLNIRSISRFLKNFADYTILLTGHAARLLTGERAAVEQREVLLPLSQLRVEQIRRALIILGIEDNRIATQWVGGLEPEIENPSAENIWRNRRVEFAPIGTISSDSTGEESTEEGP